MNKDVKRPAPGRRPPAKIDTKTLKRLLTYMKPYRGTMIVVTDLHPAQRRCGRQFPPCSCKL